MEKLMQLEIELQKRIAKLKEKNSKG